MRRHPAPRRRRGRGQADVRRRGVARPRHRTADSRRAGKRGPPPRHRAHRAGDRQPAAARAGAVPRARLSPDPRVRRVRRLAGHEHLHGEDALSTRIALLRGINVGGNTMVAMSDLRALAARLGLREPRTLLQSGNLVFDSDKSPAQIEKLLEKELDGVDVFVRTAEEMANVVAGNPFPAEAKNDPARLVVLMLKDAKDAAVLN